MQTVITIEEENHGLIGIAETYADAIDYLIKAKQLDENYEVWSGDYGNTKPIKKALGKTWAKQIFCWTLDYFNNYFDGCFYLNEYKLHRAS